MPVRTAAILVALLLWPCIGFAQAARADEAPLPLAAGPMVGYATETEVMLWVRTKGPADVVFRWWPRSSDGEARLSPTVRSRKERDFCVHLRLEDLPMGTRFGYELYLNGRLARRPYRLGFQTQPHWSWRTDPPQFTVALGSCAYANDPPYDRPGEPYGGDPTIFEAIAQDRPDLMLWLGDNLYLREPDWSSRSGIRRRYRTNRAHPALQPLLGEVHHYAIWDDHDFGPNDSDSSYIHKDASLETFKLYWANPGYGLRGTPGVFTCFTWGDAQFFLLDGRYHRSPNRTPIDEKKTMFGEEQLRWLIDGLTSSIRPFAAIA